MTTRPGIRAWLEARAKRPWAAPALYALSFFDACVSPVIPEVLLAPLCVARPAQRWRLALWCGVWSVAGGVCGYLLGLLFWEAGLRELAFAHVPGFTPDQFDHIAARYGENAFLWVFLAGFTPLPFKLFAVAAGVCHHHVGLPVFVAAAAASRIPRFLLTVALIHATGPLARRLTRIPVWATAAIAVGVLALLLI